MEKKTPEKCIPYPELIREHEKLIRDLQGTEDELKEQSKELEEYKQEFKDAKKAKGDMEIISPGLAPVASRFPAISRVLANVSRLAVPALIRAWKEAATDAEQFRHPDGIDLPILQFDLWDIEHELDLPYAFSDSSDQWIDDEGNGIDAEDVRDLAGQHLIERMAKARKELNDQYGLDVDIEVEGAGTNNDPYSIIMRYDDRQANPILEKIQLN